MDKSAFDPAGGPQAAAPAAPAARHARETYTRIERSLALLAERFPAETPLDDAAAAAGLSPAHFQRCFTRFAGVSPKQFQRALRLEAAKLALEQAPNLLAASLDAGLSGTARLHDLFVKLEAVTPAEYRRRGSGLVIRYGFHDTPFGEALLMVSARGLCGLGFVGDGGREACLANLRRNIPRADYRAAQGETAPWVTRIFREPGDDPRDAGLKLFLHGTEFQIGVWRALLELPSGSLCAYGALAAHIGRPDAPRAVASAVGANPISWLVPCHRVIRSSGGLGGYRWGLGRKLWMLAGERGAADST